MLIKNLSKADYYKSRNIPIPKAIHKLTPQPAVRSHLLEPIPTLAVQIKRHLECKKNRQNKELQFVGYEQALHQQQVKVQDLNKLLATKQDQITQLKGEQEKYLRKIGYLDKEVFDLQSQLQKIEYEYKSTIQLLKAQNYSQQSQYQQKITCLEDQSRKGKQEFEYQLKIFKQSYDLKLKSYSGDKQAFKQVSQVVKSNLQRDIDFYLSQNKRLKNQLILSEKQSIQKLRHYQEQNFQLKDNIESNTVSHSLQIMKTHTQIDLKDSKIKQLNEKIQQMKNLYENEKQKISNQKQYYEKSKTERQEKWKQRVEELIKQKQSIQKQLSKAFNQLNDARDTSSNFEKKYNQVSNKISFMEFERQQMLSQHRISLQQIRQSCKISMQNQLLSMKKNYQQKISSAQNEIDIKNNEILFLKDKYSRSLKQGEQKYTLIKKMQEKQMLVNEENQKIVMKYQISQKQFSKLRNQFELTKIQHQNQKILLRTQIKAQQFQQAQKAIKALGIANQKLKKQLSETRIAHQLDLKILKQDLRKKAFQFETVNQKIITLTRQRDQQETKLQSLNLIYEKQITQHKKYVQELKRLIQDEAQALKKNAQNMEQIKIEYDKIKFQLEKKELDNQKLSKQLRLSHQEHDQLKLQSIRRCSEIQQEMSSMIRQIQRQRNQVVMNLKKGEGQIANLSCKLQSSERLIINLQNQKQLYQGENEKLKQAINRKEQDTSNLLNELNSEKRQISEKINQDYKQKMLKIQQKNQTLIQQINGLKEKNLQLIQKENIRETFFIDLETKITQKQKQIAYYTQKSEIEHSQVLKLEQKIVKLCSKILVIETQKKRFQSENQILLQKVQKFESNMMQMKKSNIYQSDLMQDLKSRNSRLLIVSEQQKMEIQYQLSEKQKLKLYLRQAQKQLELTKHQLAVMNDEAQKTRQKQQEQFFSIKVNQVKVQYEAKNRELFEKILQVQEMIKLKDQQIVKTKNMMMEKDELIDRYRRNQIEYKKFEQQHRKFKAGLTELVNQFQRCNLMLVQKDRQLIKTKAHLNQVEEKAKAEVQQLQIQCFQLNSNLSIAVQQLDSQKKNHNQVKSQYQVQSTKLTKYRQQNDLLTKQRQELKNKVRMMEQYKTQIREQLINEYDQIIKKHRAEKHQEITSIEEQFQRIIKQLRKQVQNLNDQKMKIKNQFHIYKSKSDDQLARFQGQLLTFKQTINKLKRTNEYLLQYKKRWDKISGQVKQYENLDSKDVEQVQFVIINEQMKTSIIIQNPVFSKPIQKQGPLFHANLSKSFLETPQTAHKQTIQKKKYRYEDVDKYD